MLMWLADNMGTICAALILSAILALIILKLIDDKKKGKSSCGCNCAHCAMAGQCHKNSGELLSADSKDGQTYGTNQRISA